MHPKLLLDDEDEDDNDNDNDIDNDKDNDNYFHSPYHPYAPALCATQTAEHKIG